VTLKLLAAELMAQREHSPPQGAHFILLGGVVIAALVVFGSRWWRARRSAGSGDESGFSDRLTEHRSSEESERDAGPDT
jgi:hypothetical protein